MNSNAFTNRQFSFSGQQKAVPLYKVARSSKRNLCAANGRPVSESCKDNDAASKVLSMFHGEIVNTAWPDNPISDMI
jgi:hypothetical protein